MGTGEAREHQFMLTGEIRSRVYQIWNAFWQGFRVSPEVSEWNWGGNSLRDNELRNPGFRLCGWGAAIAGSLHGKPIVQPRRDPEAPLKNTSAGITNLRSNTVKPGKLVSDNPNHH